MPNRKKSIFRLLFSLICCLAFLQVNAQTDTNTGSNEVTAPKIRASNMKKDLEAKFMETNKKIPGIVTTDSGLQYKVVTQGSGKIPGKDDTVEVEYEGKLLNGQIFDSSFQRGESITFPVSGVIQGWQEALQLMPEGSTWMLYIPSNLAYGEVGAGGVIGAYETLVFKVHLIRVK